MFIVVLWLPVVMLTPVCLCLYNVCVWSFLSVVVGQNPFSNKFSSTSHYRGIPGKSAIADRSIGGISNTKWTGMGQGCSTGPPGMSMQLNLKEALHIEWTPANTRLNHDQAMSYQAARSLRGRGQLTAPALITLAQMLRLLHQTSCRSHTYKKNTTIFASYFIFALMTRASHMFL